MGCRTTRAHKCSTLFSLKAAHSVAFNDKRVIGCRPERPFGSVINFICYRLRNCGRWKFLPTEFGPWKSICGYYRQWSRTGLWARILGAIVKRSGCTVRLLGGIQMVVHHFTANPIGCVESQATCNTRGGRMPRLIAVADINGRLLSMKSIVLKI